MQIKGYFGEYKRRNEKTGESWFTVISAGRLYNCHGITLHYPYGIPLVINGDNIGRNKIEVSDCRINKEDNVTTKGFLCTDVFEQIGKSKAEDLIDKAKPNIYEYSKECIKDINELTPSELKALDKIRYYVLFEELYQKLKDKGFNYINISKIYKQYNDLSMDKIIKNPYLLLYCDAEFILCEKLAMEYGMEYCDPKRIRSIVEFVMQRNNSSGNSRMTFFELCKQIHILEKRLNVYKPLDDVFIAEEVITDKYRLTEFNGILYVYFKTDYHTEISIVNNINRLMNQTKIYEYKKDYIDEIEEIYDIEYSEEQKRAFEVCNSSGIKLITGDPGAGKTTVLNGIIYKFSREYPDKKITLCAPTGCAARRMREATGKDATTIHKLLKLRPYMGSALTAVDIIDTDMIIIDEFSMVDMYIASLLLGALKNETIIILVGDPNQLDSVSAGNVLNSLINMNKFEHHRLNMIYRQDSRSNIIINSKYVLKDNINLKQDKNFKIYRFETEEEIVDRVKKIAESCNDRGVDFKLFTPSKKSKFKTGSINMNRLLSNIKCGADNDDNALYYGEYIFHVGDKVIFIQNNYNLRYYNGMDGVISCIQKHTNAILVTIQTEDGEITLKDNEIDDIELGYAITAHKSQGSECENSLIIVPLEPRTMLQRRLLYVEITRARKNVIILTQKDALSQSIHNFYERKRNTGLLDMI